MNVERSKEQRAKARPRILAASPTFARRWELLEKIAKLASELCTAVDREAEDIGGSRPSLVILQELGPLTDRLERLQPKPLKQGPHDKVYAEGIKWLDSL